MCLPGAAARAAAPAHARGLACPSAGGRPGCRCRRPALARLLHRPRAAPAHRHRAGAQPRPARGRAARRRGARGLPDPALRAVPGHWRGRPGRAGARAWRSQPLGPLRGQRRVPRRGRLQQLGAGPVGPRAQPQGRGPADLAGQRCGPPRRADRADRPGGRRLPGPARAGRARGHCARDAGHAPGILSHLHAPRGRGRQLTPAAGPGPDPADPGAGPAGPAGAGTRAAAARTGAAGRRPPGPAARRRTL